MPLALTWQVTVDVVERLALLLKDVLYPQTHLTAQYATAPACVLAKQAMHRARAANQEGPSIAEVTLMPHHRQHAGNDMPFDSKFVSADAGLLWGQVLLAGSNS